MKKYLLIFVLCICVTSIAFAETNLNEFDETDKIIDLINDTSLELKDTFLKECPFNHKDVKRIPIIAGYIAIGPELQKKIDNLEIWYAGCEVGKEKYQVVCAKCRYAYNPYQRYWFKDERNPNNFEIELDKSITSFLQLFENQFEIDAINFTQSIKNKNDYIDRVTFFAKAKKPNILEILKKYFTEYSIQPKENIISEINAVYYEYQDGNKKFNISIEKSVNKYEIITYKVTNKNI